MRSVAIIRTEPQYPGKPFSPHTKYPEYLFSHMSSSTNYVYDAIRQTFITLGLDKRHIGTSQWNPFGHIIRPGDRVLIKPNLVNSYHLDGGDLLAVVTHGSVIRAAMDYTIIALKADGEIIVGDSPERMANFDEICDRVGLNSILTFYEFHKHSIGNIKIYARDFRKEWIKYGLGAIVRRKRLKGDPEGYTLVRLHEQTSAFSSLTGAERRKLYGADYNRRKTLRAHTKGFDQYEMSGTPLNVDAIVSLPKLKTHYRVGTTLNCKGLVGVTGDKNLVPHRRLGDPTNGGDTYEYPARRLSGSIYRRLNDFLKDNLLGFMEHYSSALMYTVILKAFAAMSKPRIEDIHYHGGCWHGNDTTWRSVVDLTRISLFSDRNGIIQKKQQRNLISVVDGIVGGDIDGPMRCRPRKSGVIVCGQDILAVDIVASYLMGFDPLKLRYISALLRPNSWGDLSMEYPDGISVSSNVSKYRHLFSLRRDNTLLYDAPSRWKGHIELDLS